jgi:hypothetical protein
MNGLRIKMAEYWNENYYQSHKRWPPGRMALEEGAHGFS